MRTLPPLLLALATAAGALPARAQPCALDPARVTAAADTFEIRVGGRPIGTQTMLLEPSESGWRFRETTTLASGSQTTEVRMDGALALQRVAQRGRMGGREMRIGVLVRDGRASGMAVTPAGGDGEVPVDVALPPCAVDDNTLAALLPALAWAPGARWTVPVFASGKGTVEPHALEVLGEEEVTVPAGTLRAYRARVTGGDRQLVVHVAADAPHRLLRIEVEGTPMEIVRTGPRAP
jgi:hypothetical protein